MSKRKLERRYIYQRKDGRYEVRISGPLNMRTGKPRTISRYTRSEEDAQRILLEFLQNPQMTQYADLQQVTVAQWFNIWLESYMRNAIKQSTYVSYRTYAKKHFEPSIGTVKLRDITPRLLQEFYNYKFEEEGLSPKTISNMNLCLHSALNKAQQEGILRSNPASGLKLPRGTRAEIEVLTRDQQVCLIRESYRSRYGVFIRLALATGIRIGELLGLQWSDIDFSAGVLKVQHTLNRLMKTTEVKSGENSTEIVLSDPKTANSVRSIPLLPSSLRDLQQWKLQQAKDEELAGEAYKTDGFVVTNEIGGYIEPRTFRDYYKDLLTSVNLEKFTFHALRHTFATRALEQGMDSKTLSSLLGHYSVAFTLDTYAHVLDDHKRDGMKLMAELFEHPVTESQAFPAIISQGSDGYIARMPDFPHLEAHEETMDSCVQSITRLLKDEMEGMLVMPPPTPQQEILLKRGELLLYITVEQSPLLM